jgi:hypothetical protein
MARSRPGALGITYGVIAIVTGCLFLGCGVCGGIKIVSTEKMNYPPIVTNVNNIQKDIAPEFTAYMNQNVPVYTVFRIIDTCLNLVLAFGFIGAGVGLFLAPKWGQVATLLLALLSILNQFLCVLWQVVWIAPAMTKFGELYPLLNLHLRAGGETFFTVVWAIIFFLLDLGFLIGLSLPFAWRKYWGSARQDRAFAEDEGEPRRRDSTSEAFEEDDDYRR